MKYPKRSQYKHAESQYRVRNWPEYEAGLRRRGDLTVWLSAEARDTWSETPSGKPGGQRTYADIAIEAALTIRVVFHLPLRLKDRGTAPKLIFEETPSQRQEFLPPRFISPSWRRSLVR